VRWFVEVPSSEVCVDLYCSGSWCGGSWVSFMSCFGFKFLCKFGFIQLLFVSLREMVMASQ
jgi:hypothetical protein